MLIIGFQTEVSDFALAIICRCVRPDSSRAKGSSHVGMYECVFFMMVTIIDELIGLVNT